MSSSCQEVRILQHVGVGTTACVPIDRQINIFCNSIGKENWPIEVNISSHLFFAVQFPGVAVSSLDERKSNTYLEISMGTISIITGSKPRTFPPIIQVVIFVPFGSIVISPLIKYGGGTSKIKIDLVTKIYIYIYIMRMHM